MALAVKRIYDQMAEPKWVIGHGRVRIDGRDVSQLRVLQGVDPVFCRWMCMWRVVPPRPEALLDALIRLQNKVAKEPVIATQKKVAA